MQILTLAFLLLVSSGDGESVYKALDQNDSTALERYDTKKIMKEKSLFIVFQYSMLKL